MYFDKNTTFVDGQTSFSAEDIKVQINGHRIGNIFGIAIDESFKNRGFFEFYNFIDSDVLSLKKYTKCLGSLKVFATNEDGDDYIFFDGTVCFDSSYSKIPLKDIPFESENVTAYKIGFNSLPGVELNLSCTNMEIPNCTLTGTIHLKSSYTIDDLESL